MENEDNVEFLEEQTLNVEANNQNLGELVDAPMIGQTFGSWDELDHFISFYAKSQNFVSQSTKKNKTSIVETQQQTQSKRTGCPWQIRASCPKTTGVLSITSLHLSNNNHPVKDKTNKFASKYRAFSENMLKDIKFWTEIAAILLNYLLERKSDDNRWVINWKVDPTTNSLNSLFWISPDQHDLYLCYWDVIQHDNTYSTNQFKMVLSFFVIVDNNNRSRLVGQALINDKTAESYEWVFKTLIMNTKAEPLTIITDKDLAAK
ncbi:25751_t:CDS:2, partial [Gigaspora margarita]